MVRAHGYERFVNNKGQIDVPPRVAELLVKEDENWSYVNEVLTKEKPAEVEIKVEKKPVKQEEIVTKEQKIVVDESFRKDDLLAIAEQLGLEVSKRWVKAKLIDVINNS